MLLWWNSLGLASQIFYCIAIPSTLVLLIQTVLMFIGFDESADGDIDVDIDLSAATSADGVFGDGDIDDLFSELSISDINEDETDAYGHIYVIIPNGCSGELSLKARELSNAIGEKTGIFTSLKYDSELSSPPNDSLEILLGFTNRLASKDAADKLRDGD